MNFEEGLLYLIKKIKAGNYEILKYVKDIDKEKLDYKNEFKVLL